MKRITANKAILEILSRLVEENPDLRFHQLLAAADVLKKVWSAESRIEYVDEFYVESDVVLTRVKKSAIVNR